MLNMAIFGLDVVGVEVCNFGDFRMRDPAVIALVVVVGQDLPVKFAFHVPGVIEDVVLEIVVVEPRLLVDPVKVVLPSNLGGLGCVEVHPDETVSVNVHMDRREIFAEESLDVVLLVFADDELVANDVVSDPVAGVGDAMLVRGEEPLAGEDRSSFEFVHRLGSIPGSGQGTDRGLLALCLLHWRGRRAKEIPQKRHDDG